jgi:hypothetical protein
VRDAGPVAHLDDRVAFRWADYDTPLWARDNRTAGRWNTPGDGPTQYGCLDPSGPWAELLRHEGLRDEAELDLLRAALWVARWSVGPLADLATFAEAEAWGVDPRVLVEDDHRACRRLARELRGRGFAGVLAPSAALPGSVTLVVFRPRVRAPYASVPRLASQVPAEIAAVGRPRRGLAALVRHFGERHAGLDAHRRARRRGSPGGRPPS